MTSFRSQIIGTWELVSYKAFNQDNPEDIVYPMGKAARGQIMYSQDGYMAAVLQDESVEPYERDWTRGTTRELANVAKQTNAYCGPFSLDEQPGNKQKVIHHAQIAVPPNWAGTSQLRLAEMIDEDGEKFLILGPEWALEVKGIKRILKLKWRKRPVNDITQPPKAKL